MNPKNPFGAKPTYMSVDREKVNEDNAPILNAQKLALNKLNLNRRRDNSVKQHSLDEYIDPPGSLYNKSSNGINSSDPRVSKENFDDGFIEVTRKKKKRKTYERMNSAKTSERNNKAKNDDTPYCIQIL